MMRDIVRDSMSLERVGFLHDGVLRARGAADGIARHLRGRLVLRAAGHGGDRHAHGARRSRPRSAAHGRRRRVEDGRVWCGHRRRRGRRSRRGHLSACSKSATSARFRSSSRPPSSAIVADARVVLPGMASHPALADGGDPQRARDDVAVDARRPCGETLAASVPGGLARRRWAARAGRRSADRVRGGGARRVVFLWRRSSAPSRHCASGWARQSVVLLEQVVGRIPRARRDSGGCRPSALAAGRRLSRGPAPVLQLPAAVHDRRSRQLAALGARPLIRSTSRRFRRLLDSGARMAVPLRAKGDILGLLLLGPSGERRAVQRRREAPPAPMRRATDADDRERAADHADRRAGEAPPRCRPGG